MKKPAHRLSSSSKKIKCDLSFFKRAALTRHPVAQKLLQVMEKKKSNLALSADLTSQSELLKLVELVAPELCMVKTHVDIIEDFTPDFGKKLRALADKHNFLIFEDRKFADIGHVVAQQFSKGIYHISDWADIINAHIIAGAGTIEGLKQIGLKKGQGLLLIAEMSADGNLAKGTYTKKAVALAEEHPDFCMGFISLQKLSSIPGMIHCTPGVQLKPGKDALGQRYRTVEEIITEKKSDLIIVGRDITAAKDPLKQASLYRKAAWDAYLARTNH